MVRTFGEELLHFAQSVDIIDLETCALVRDILHEYFDTVLRIDFYEVQTDDIQIEGRPGLRTCMTGKLHWTNGQENSTPIRTASGDYRDQTTFAYEARNVLWVTEKDGNVLKADSECVNRWPDSKYSLPLPPYWEFVGNMRTQIVFPLQYGDHVFGVLNLETKRILEYTSFAGEELKRISSAIAIVLWLHDTNMNQTVGTRRALDNVARSLKGNRNPSPLTKSKIFLASSSRADDQVIGIIRGVISEYHSQIDEVFWKNITESGNVNSQILVALNDCSLGICYFSEPAAHGASGTEYVDNLNVVFEAGMLHALTNASTGAPKKWIPVREPRSAATPFDFASERTVVVSRLASGALNEELFARDLRQRLAAALMV